MALEGKKLTAEFIRAAAQFKEDAQAEIQIGGRVFQAQRIDNEERFSSFSKGNHSIHFTLSEADQGDDLVLVNHDRDGREDKINDIRVIYNDQAGIHVRAHCDVERSVPRGSSKFYSYYSTQDMLERGLKL